MSENILPFEICNILSTVNDELIDIPGSKAPFAIQIFLKYCFKIVFRAFFIWTHQSGHKTIQTIIHSPLLLCHHKQTFKHIFLV